MPLFTFLCSNPECRAEREVLCKVSERESLMEWCTKCEWITRDVGVATAVDDHDEDALVSDVEEKRSWKIQRIMRWKGVEAAIHRSDGKFTMKAIMSDGSKVSGTFGHSTRKRSDM